MQASEVARIASMVARAVSPTEKPMHDLPEMIGSAVLELSAAHLARVPTVNQVVWLKLRCETDRVDVAVPADIYRM